jgi:hypothetical protein
MSESGEADYCHWVSDDVLDDLRKVTGRYIKKHKMDPGHVCGHMAIIIGEMIGTHSLSTDEVKEHVKRAQKTLSFEAHDWFEANAILDGERT